LKRLSDFLNLLRVIWIKRNNCKPFYGLDPSVENFKKQILIKKESYPDAHRKILVKTLKAQYTSITHSKAVAKNLTLLEKENTFTITTGHQLSLMTGPLYFLYKIVSTITFVNV
jgi:uncharacterized protein YllA (UPF0747 family)